MKIPPKSMFVVQIVGTLISSSVYFGTGWWLLTSFPEKTWIKYINVPIILSGTGGMPAVKAVNYTCWLSVGIVFNLVVYNRYRGWWVRNNYILSAGLDAGVAFSAVVLFFTLQMKNINGPTWWGLEVSDHCPLATCPTAPGIQVEGCPVFQ
ncbi:hypothetical protein NC651_014781 [Populus alba x Populus x berolinensis]|nr:hypothetical protein NC651_014781 [Populus alba x Populus x berolinensis]